MTTSSTTIRRISSLLFAVALIAAACSSDSDAGVIQLGEDGGLTPAESTVEADSDSALAGQEFDFTYVDFDGESLAFSELSDKPTVLNFFASWCASCIAELPDFQATHAALGDDVAFLGLAMQDRQVDAAELIEETGVEYEVGLDDRGRIFGLFEGLGMPTTVFLHADGTVARVHSGVLDQQGLTDLINSELLTEGSSS